jgi:hypothetical protein
LSGGGELGDRIRSHDWAATPLEVNELRSGLGAHWPFLSDPGRKVQKDLDIAEYTDPTHNPMIPHTLVLERGFGRHGRACVPSPVTTQVVTRAPFSKSRRIDCPPLRVARHGARE